MICSDILQYLNDEEATTAIENLARLTGGVLYFAVLTELDWQENCDQERTDRQSYLRTGAWYRERLAHHFTNIGGGLFVSRHSPAVLYDLEALP